MNSVEKHVLELKRMDAEYSIDAWKLSMKQNAKKIKEIEFSLATIQASNQKMKQDIESKQEELTILEEQLTQ